jgi:cysteinyl-tRNA synthetase
MELKLYDTLTRTKRVFEPIDPVRVRMYVCGPTVYDFAHIGNARPVIVFDVLFRLLRYRYGPDHVTYVRNITDVDDKINARAAERGISIRELTETTLQNFREDVAALGCLPPSVEPRATEHIEAMKVLIERLVKSGHAYVAEDHVLFSVPSMPDYGQLSRRPLDEMIAGARVEVAPYKRDAMDFVLWKPSKANEPAWPSPCAIATPGRPGWHIECSAMSWKHLGETFDIHGGGIDLVFPHHENEIAQSRSAFHTPVMANYWMHNGFLQLGGEKMAKSTGKLVTIRELLTGQGLDLPWPGVAIRFAMLMTHYTQPLEWSVERLAEASASLHRFHQVCVTGLDLPPVDANARAIEEAIGNGKPSDLLLNALGDDLNTPAAISHLFSLVREAHHGGRIQREPARQLLIDCEFLGLSPFRFVDEERAAFRAHMRLDEQRIAELISARTEARKAKNFAESDRIRDELAAMGIVLKDSKDGTTWEIAR